MVLALFFGLAMPMTPRAAPPETLNQKRIHADYNEGNFERVTSTLEGFMARNKTYSLADSVFIVKHLAVVYSANPETREKGKYYMYRLLTILPSAKLIDMFVSDEIDRIFEKVREEFLARQKSFGVDSSQISLPGKAASGPQLAKMDPPGESAAPTSASSRPVAASQPTAGDRNKNSEIAYFVAGGAALIAVGTASYFIFGESPKKTEKTYDVP